MSYPSFGTGFLLHFIYINVLVIMDTTNFKVYELITLIALSSRNNEYDSLLQDKDFVSCLSAAVFCDLVLEGNLITYQGYQIQIVKPYTGDDKILSAVMDIMEVKVNRSRIFRPFLFPSIYFWTQSPDEEFEPVMEEILRTVLAKVNLKSFPLTKDYQAKTNSEYRLNNLDAFRIEMKTRLINATFSNAREMVVPLILKEFYGLKFILDKSEKINIYLFDVLNDSKYELTKKQIESIVSTVLNESNR